VSKLGGEGVKRFHWSNHSTRTSEFSKRVREKPNRANLI